MTVTWVVGGGGLLGRHVVATLRRQHRPVLTTAVPWQDAVAATEALRLGVARLREAAAGGPWAVAWCAGAGIVGTPKEQLDTEVSVFSGCLDELGGVGPGGALFLASSAGGVYAGSPAAPPYTEDSPVRALAPYGEAKLEMERAAKAFASTTGTRLLIGRISNLYGPGQNLAKPQGLVSLLCKAQLSGQPLGVFVSLDTLRDYLFVGDCAAMVVAGLDRIAAGDEEVVTKIFASGRGTSIAALVGEATKVFRRRPPLVFKASAVSAFQVRDLRLHSVVWPDLSSLARTPLAVGLASTGEDLRMAIARQGISL